MIKNIVLFLLFLTIGSAWCNENWEEINNILKNEEKYLTDVQKKCNNYLKEKPDSTLKEYYSNRNQIKTLDELKPVISALRKIGCCKSKKCTSILDENIFMLLINLLSVVQDKKTAYNISMYLYEKKNYEYFKTNSAEIIDALYSENLSGMEAYLLVFCNLGDKEKKTVQEKLNIINQNSLPLYIRIRLGEKKAEDTLLQIYEKENDFEKLKKLIEQLELSGTKRCEMALVNSLGTKDQEQHSRSYSYSIRYFIIQALGKLNPQSTILNDDLYDYRELIGENPFNDELKSKLTKEYFNNLYDYIETHYNKKINELKNATFLYSFCITKTPIDLDDVKKDKLR